jgi:hypothetical protein
LASALPTAVAVAGGVLAAQTLTGLFAAEEATAAADPFRDSSGVDGETDPGLDAELDGSMFDAF